MRRATRSRPVSSTSASSPGPLPDDQRRAAHTVISLLLDYPTAEAAAHRADVEDVVAGLPPDVRQPLRAFLDATASVPLRELQAAYVATFDLKRRCSLYLSYYAAGDTRKRGAALVTFVEAFRAAGWETDGSELPDHLPTVLELSARTDGAIAGMVLDAHRDGIEVLRAALETLRSPYAYVVAALVATLPAMQSETAARFRDLVAAGPPTELVGLSDLSHLTPFATIPSLTEETRR
ncbi:nitrate reductase molybdenum cofactor assembly chaperone [Cellulosimicrobium sp. ES-005]|uniref:Nitrate reductase molybdenum cofactor assembly chaperone n=1 Tax=Cellulosimicrobium sp. ES-005 TaxID=3163031 RepID=A0AAU8G2H8_9MICO